MIKVKMALLLGQHKMTRKKLSELTGVRPNTIGNMYDETVQRIDISAIDRICRTLNCRVEDLLEYVPDEESGENQEIIRYAKK